MDTVSIAGILQSSWLIQTLDSVRTSDPGARQQIENMVRKQLNLSFPALEAVIPALVGLDPETVLNQLSQMPSPAAVPLSKVFKR